MLYLLSFDLGFLSSDARIFQLESHHGLGRWLRECGVLPLDSFKITALLVNPRVRLW
ncbi:hypothetical protein [Synechococcus sp. UW140]|uniref:hypothetical protein n=1 Tax=Synechococcus sp. UW140 TaxID=368503 RepID=UPI001483BD2D|nr:hypothetical protein [Synechococcus sp. UW140]